MEPKKPKKPYDLLMWVGEDSYPTPWAMIREIGARGLSKRLSLNSVPDNVEPGASRIFLVHPKARLQLGKGHLAELQEDLKLLCTTFSSEQVEEIMKQLPEIEAPDGEVVDPFHTFTAHMIGVFQAVTDSSLFQEALRETLARFEVSVVPGIFAFCYYTGLTYTLEEGEVLPAHLDAKGVEAHYPKGAKEDERKSIH